MDIRSRDLINICRIAVASVQAVAELSKNQVTAYLGTVRSEIVRSSKIATTVIFKNTKTS